MIPPNASLVKYDNPVLVSRNTDKKTPRVCKVTTSELIFVGLNEYIQ
jgi:dynein light intermediate chain